MFRDSLSAAREDKANLEKKQRLDKADLERREAAVRAKEREGDRLRDDLVRSESSSVSLQSENDALRLLDSRPRSFPLSLSILALSLALCPSVSLSLSDVWNQHWIFY